MSGRKRKSSSETDSRDGAAANRKAKKQHSETEANITVQKDSGSPGPSGTTVIMDSSISAPTTNLSVDTMISTTNPPSLNPIMTPNTISSTRSEQEPDGNYSEIAICSAVVVEVFSKIMQELLATQIQATHLYNKVKHHTDFKKRLSGDELITIESLTTDGFSKLNFTLIYKIFKFFDFIQPPTNIWGTMPSENEIEIGDDVERMRFARKNLVYSYRIDCDMQNSEFETFFADYVQLSKRVDIHLKLTDISFLLSVRNKYLSEFMNAFKRAMPLATMTQKAVKRRNNISEILCELLKIPIPEWVGSVAEGSEDIDSDKDWIWFSDNYEGFDSLICLPIPEEGHPGYSKIRVQSVITCGLEKYTIKKDGIVYLKNTMKELVKKDLEIIKKKIFPQDFPFNYSIHGPAYKIVVRYVNNESAVPNNKDIEELDSVFCIKRKSWPVQASDWETRSRASNWPTRKLVDHIIKEGYYLAAVGSKESDDSEIQWRVSFNKAEQLIIESFNETQMHCILLLKSLKNDMCRLNIVGKNITSYTMKTVMFWCLEMKSKDYWQSSNLMCCFRLCVSKLYSFVEKAFLPNYFIKERNLFIASEFTRDIQRKTKLYLESCLEDPNTQISLLLKWYKEYANTQICLWHERTQKSVITEWLKNHVSMASLNQSNFVTGLMALYDGYSIKFILKRCNEAMDKLKTLIYTQPLIKKLQNYMGVLNYILIREERETGVHRTDADTQDNYSKYTKLSAPGDLTHNPLRIATCYLDDGAHVQEDCINIIHTVTNLGDEFFMRTHSQCLKETLKCSKEALRILDNAKEIQTVMDIINDIDFIYRDPYKTTAKFEQLKASGQLLIGNDVLILAWKRCYFDVTFMLAELPVLPKPAALELCVDRNQITVTFHPFLYGLLLEYLWHEKNGSGYEEKEPVLEKMKNCVSNASIIPDKQKSVGLNFMAYCYSLQNDYSSVSRCFARSLRLHPIKNNVAYQYMKYRIKRLRQS